MRLADVGIVIKVLGKAMKRGGWLVEGGQKAPQTAIWLSLATELCNRGGQEIGVAVLQLMSGDILEVGVLRSAVFCGLNWCVDLQAV